MLIMHFFTPLTRVISFNEFFFMCVREGKGRYYFTGLQWIKTFCIIPTLP